jgi:ribosomal protein L21
VYAVIQTGASSTASSRATSFTCEARCRAESLVNFDVLLRAKVDGPGCRGALVESAKVTGNVLGNVKAPRSWSTSSGTRRTAAASRAIAQPLH